MVAHAETLWITTSTPLPRPVELGEGVVFWSAGPYGFPVAQRGFVTSIIRTGPDQVRIGAVAC